MPLNVRATSTPAGNDTTTNEVTVRVARRAHDAARGFTNSIAIPAAGTARSDQRVPGLTGRGHVSSGTVLVVDDDDGVRTVATLSLERAGFCVVSARDGEEGLALVRKHRGAFDVVLLDMTMPKLSGAVTFHLIKQLRPELPIVLTSGYIEPEVESRFGPDQIAGFLQKPFTLATLVRMIQDAVTHRAQVQV